MNIRQKAWGALRRAYGTGKKIITAPDRAIGKVTDKLIDKRVKQIQKKNIQEDSPKPFPAPAVMRVGRRIIK